MMQYPGTGGGGDPLLGGDPVVSGQTAGMHILSLMMDKAVGEQRQALFSGELESKADSLIEGIFTRLTIKAMSQMEQSPKWAPLLESVREASSTNSSGPKSASPYPDAPHPSPSTSPKTASGRVSKNWGSPSAPPVDPPETVEAYESTAMYHPKTAFVEGRDRGQKMTMGSIARELGEPIAKRISDTEKEWVPVTLPDGSKVMRLMDNKTGGRWVHPLLNMEQDDIEEGNPLYDRIKGRAARQAGIRALAAGALTGGGVAGSLGAAAARVAGPVGIAIGAAQAGGSWLERQQAASEPYKQIYGDETSTFAAKERFGSWLSGLEGFGTIGADSAREHYARASAMGLKGDSRDSATSFMASSQRRFGLSGEDSAQMVNQVLSQGGGTGALNDFAEAMTNVSRSAVAAGRTSEQAIKGFSAAQSYLGSITNTSAATGLAEVLGGVSVKLPKDLSEKMGDAEGLAKGMLTQSNVYQMAALNGEDAMVASWNLAGGGSAATAQGARTVEQVGEQFITEVALFFGMSSEDFKAAMQAQIGTRDVSPEAVHSAIETLFGAQMGGQLLEFLSLSVPRLFGPKEKLTGLNMLTLLSQALSKVFVVELPDPGSSTPGSLSSRKKPSPQPKGMARGLASQQAPGDMDYEQLDKPSVRTSSRAPAPFGSEEWNAQREEILTNLGMGGAHTFSQMLGAEDSVNAYIDSVGESGVGDETLEMLLNPANRKKILADTGVEKLDDLKLRLNGKDMTLEDAIRGGMSGEELRDADVVRNGGLSPQPVHVILDLTEPAKELVNQGPTDNQRNGVPSSGETRPNQWGRYGGRAR